MTWHKNLLKILMVARCKENELMERDQTWYKVEWGQGAVLKNENAKMRWDFEYNRRKESTARSTIGGRSQLLESLLSLEH